MPSLQSLQERHRKNKLSMLLHPYGSGEYKIAELNCAIIAGQIKDLRKPILADQLKEVENNIILSGRWPRF